MKLNFNILIKITKDKEGNNITDISIESKDISNYIIERDKLISDKIFKDKPELVLIKLDHNKKLDKVRKALFEEMYFKVSRCDIVAAQAVKEEMKKINDQQEIRDEQRVIREQKLEQQIELLMNEIKILKENQK